MGHRPEWVASTQWRRGQGIWLGSAKGGPIEPNLRILKADGQNAHSLPGHIAAVRLSMNAPSLTDVIAFIRESQRIPSRVSIQAHTLLDADLGITGLDGPELLREAEAYFGITLAQSDGYVTTFSLKPNEYLFGAEGLDLLGIGGAIAYVIRRLRGIPAPTVRDLTVGELHAALVREWREPRRMEESTKAGC